MGKSSEQMFCKLGKSEILRLFSIVHVDMETTKTSNFTCHSNRSSVYCSLAKFQLVGCNLSLAMIWQMIYTHKLPKLCSATLKGMCHLLHVFVCLKSQLRAKQICPPSIISNVVKNKNELWKTVRLTSFQKSTAIAICFDLLQVCSFAPPFVFLYFLCYLYFLLMAFSC